MAPRMSLDVGLCTAVALLEAACQAFLLRPRTPVIRVMGACPPLRPLPASTGGSAVQSNGNGSQRLGVQC